MMQVQWTSDVPWERMVQWCDGTYVQKWNPKCIQFVSQWDIQNGKNMHDSSQWVIQNEKTCMNHERIRSWTIEIIGMG